MKFFLLCCFCLCLPFSTAFATTKSWNFLDSSDYIYNSENVIIKDMRVSVQPSRQISVDSLLDSSGQLYELNAVDAKAIVLDSSSASDIELVSSIVDSQMVDTAWHAFNIISDFNSVEIYIKADNDRNRVALLPFVKFSDSVVGQYMQFKLLIKNRAQSFPARIDSIEIINSQQSFEFDLEIFPAQYLKAAKHVIIEKSDGAYLAEGSYESAVYDASYAASWENLTLKSSLYLEESSETKEGYSQVFYMDVFDSGNMDHCIVATDIDNKKNIYINGVEKNISDFVIPQNIESKEYHYFIGSLEANILYKQSLASLAVQLRSCDTDSCRGYDFIGPDGTSKTFFDASSSIDLSILDDQKQYFQYKVFFKTEDIHFSPKVYSSELSYNSFPKEALTIMPKNTNEFNCPAYSALNSFNDSASAGFVNYQITNEALSASPLWYYWTGSSWQLAADSKQSNSAATINANLNKFEKPGTFSYRAFLSPLGANFALNAVALEYEADLTDKDTEIEIKLEHKVEEIFAEDLNQQETDFFDGEIISNILQAVDAKTQALPFLNDVKCDLLILVRDLNDPLKKSKVINLRKATEYWGAKEIEKFILFRVALPKEKIELYQNEIASNKLFLDLSSLGLTDTVIKDLNKDQVIFLNKLFRKKLLKQTILNEE